MCARSHFSGSSRMGTMAVMAGFWRDLGGGRHAEVSTDFDHALMREVMRTELVRIKALIATSVLLSLFITGLYLFDPYAVPHLWRGTMPPSALFLVLIPFVLFELWVHAAISRHLKMDRDIPIVRRYIGALIETTMPTIALALHIENMGQVQALGFVGPLAYFIFIILSTLRLDFWLSTFTGFVAAAALRGMSIFYHPTVPPDAPPDIYYHGARSVFVLICVVLAGAVGGQVRPGFAASIRAATARDRITNLFGQHVSPQVVERLMTEGASTGSDIRRVAVMFVDFRSFTAATRWRAPQPVVGRLDGAFAVLVEILDRHGGIGNKFLGDGFLALFGAPFQAAEAPYRAVTAAREMLLAMNTINDG